MWDGGRRITYYDQASLSAGRGDGAGDRAEPAQVALHADHHRPSPLDDSQRGPAPGDRPGDDGGARHAAGAAETRGVRCEVDPESVSEWGDEVDVMLLIQR